MAIALTGDPQFFPVPRRADDWFRPIGTPRSVELTIRDLAALGKTVFLTTHYMDEAQYLADRVAVIAEGRIVAEGPPSTLGHRDRSTARVRYRQPAGTTPPLGLGAPPGPDGFVEVAVDDAVTDVHRLLHWAVEEGVELEGFEVKRPSLEDVYLSLTDHRSGEQHDSGRHREIVVTTTALTFDKSGYVNKAFWRNPLAPFFTFAFPLMFLVIFTSLLGNGTVHIGLMSVKASTYYVAAMASFGVITARYSNIVMTMAFSAAPGYSSGSMDHRCPAVPSWAPE